MTKRQKAVQIRKEEEQAVAMYKRGKTVREITRKTAVPGWMVRGLMVADTLRHCR
jgi:hypothetical protein